MKSYDRALDYFQQVVEYCYTNGEPSPGVDSEYFQSSLINVSLCYSHLNHLVKSQETIEKAYSSCDKGCSDVILKQAHYASGVIRFKQGDKQEALKEFSKSLALSRRLRDERYELDNIISFHR